jgi:hypothetical protein
LEAPVVPDHEAFHVRVEFGTAHPCRTDMLAERLAQREPHRGGAVALPEPLAQLGGKDRSALRRQARPGLDDHREQPGHGARGIVHRMAGEADRPAGGAAADHRRQVQAVAPDGRAFADRRFERGAQAWPVGSPGLARRATERGPTDQCGVGVVVQLDERRAPEHRHRHRRPQARAHGHAQGRGPVGGGRRLIAPRDLPGGNHTFDRGAGGHMTSG